MPPCHRITDFRACTATTITGKQQTVFVNNLLWCIVGDIDSHCNPQSPLVAVYPPRNVFIGKINVICALGDLGSFDKGVTCAEFHDPWDSRPVTGSPNTFVYAGSGAAFGPAGAAAGAFGGALGV